MLYDFNLSQVVEVPARLDNTLDLFVTSNPSLVNRIITLPGLSDHEAVLADVSITPILAKCKKREVPLFQKGKWDDFKTYMTEFRDNFMSLSQV